ncbi:MAG: hypothetical protein ACREPA_11725 [Candidatus Dormibacteraceae bacterium]
MLQKTVEEQERYLRWHRIRQRRQTPRLLLRESDELLYWLEECVLEGLRLTPGWLVPRLVRLIQQADPGLQAELGRERRPAQVMEVLFRAQELLMEQSIHSREPAEVIQLFPDLAESPAESSASSACTA